MAKIPATAKTYIKWLLEHAYTTSNIVDRVAKRFVGVTHKYIRNQVGSFTAIKHYGMRLRGLPDTTNIKRLRPPSTGTDTGNIRVSVKASFDNPSREAGKRRHTVGFTFDFRKEGTLEELKAKVRKLLLEWAQKHYALSQGDAGRRIRNVQIEEMEGF